MEDGRERKEHTMAATDDGHAVQVEVQSQEEPPAGSTAEPGDTPGAGERGAAATEPIDVDPIEDLAHQRDELRDRLLRTTADFDNYRKRIDRERREQAEWAAAEVLSAILPVVDDLERALGADVAADPDGFRKGVELIHRQLLDLLARRGVVPIEAVGTPFDPRWHEAVVHEPSDAQPPGAVTAELRRGYKLGDRLLRASMVKVARA